VSNFKGFIVVVIVLLLTQQNFATNAPMNCEDMKNSTIVSSDYSSHSSSHSNSQMTMHDHGSLAKDKNSSDQGCDVCNSSDCAYCEIDSCFSPTVSISMQVVEQKHIRFVDHGKRYLSQDEYPDSGIYLLLFKPPILL